MSCEVPSNSDSDSDALLGSDSLSEVLARSLGELSERLAQASSDLATQRDNAERFSIEHEGRIVQLGHKLRRLTEENRLLKAENGRLRTSVSSNLDVGDKPEPPPYIKNQICSGAWTLKGTEPTTGNPPVADITVKGSSVFKAPVTHSSTSSTPVFPMEYQSADAIIPLECPVVPAHSLLKVGNAANLEPVRMNSPLSQVLMINSPRNSFLQPDTNTNTIGLPPNRLQGDDAKAGGEQSAAPSPKQGQLQLPSDADSAPPLRNSQLQLPGSSGPKKMDCNSVSSAGGRTSFVGGNADEDTVGPRLSCVSFADNEDAVGPRLSCVSFADNDAGERSEDANRISRISRFSSASPIAKKAKDLEVLEVWTRPQSSATFETSRVSWTATVAAFDKEDEDDEEFPQIQRFIVHPSSSKHVAWAFVGLALIAYDCVVIPLEMTFDPEQVPFTVAMSLSIHLFWTLNIPVSFLTGHLKPQGGAEMNFVKISKRYATTWLVFDLFVVCIGWLEVIVLGYGDRGSMQLGSTVRALRLSRTARLIRLMQVPEVTRFVTDNIRSEEVTLVAAIAKIMVFMLLVAHFLACLFYGIGFFWFLEEDEVTWLDYNGLFDMDLGRRYVWSFHWALSLFSGETLFAPMNVWERIFTCIVLFVCFMVSTGFVSSFTTAMTRIQLITNKTSRQLAALRRYLKDNHISRPLAVRMQHNAQYMMAEQKSSCPESSIEVLALVSDQLLVELHYEIYFPHLSHHPFFLHYAEVHPAGLRQTCHTAVSFLSLTRGDTVFKDFDQSNQRKPSMFFVVKGHMIYMRDGHTMQMRPGRWLCEAHLWTNWTYLGTLVAQTESQLLVLDAGKFQDVVHTEHARMYAKIFVRRCNTRNRLRFGDVGEGVIGLRSVCRRIFQVHNDEDDESAIVDSVEDDFKHLEEEEAEERRLNTKFKFFSSLRKSGGSNSNRSSLHSAHRPSGGHQIFAWTVGGVNSLKSDSR